MVNEIALMIPYLNSLVLDGFLRNTFTLGPVGGGGGVEGVKGVFLK